ncbi:hypothetical protein [Mycobacteroides chelonae]|nr:hypothetical protein [Mycobacteroides chelonae]
MTIWGTDPAGEKRLVIDNMLPGLGERIIANLAVVHPNGEFWLEPFDRNRLAASAAETQRPATTREAAPQTSLNQIIAGALLASLKDDEPNWPTQRNWDVDEGLVIERHAANIAAAVQKSYDTYTPEGPARFDR